MDVWIRCFGGSLEDYEFLDCGNALGTSRSLPCKQSEVAERLPR